MTSLGLFTSLYRQTSRIYVRGMSLGIRLSFWTPYQPLAEAGIRLGPAREEVTYARWARIEPTLPPGPLSVLDVGANVGFFSVKMAQRGCFVTSLDNTFYATLLHHIKTTLALPNLVATDMYLGPSNIQSLPAYDCTFLLSVFHHWCVSYGRNVALAMLAAIHAKTNQVLYFETGQPDTASAKYRSSLPEMTPDPLAWSKSYFGQHGASEVRALGVFQGRHLLAVIK